MPLITKPDFTYVWASGGAIVAPNDTKKQLGWVAEAPPFQYDNWLQNRQDQMLAHINQRGIPAWDGLTNYEAGGLSYVQGSDGKVYKSVAASGPSSVVSNPTTDATDTYWTEAFASIGAFLTQTAGDARYTQRSNNLSDLTNTATARTNLGAAPLASPTFTGTVTAPNFSGGGSGLTSLNAANISTGTLPVARGGTGVTTSTGSGNSVLSVSPALTGVPTAPTAAVGTNTTQLATTAFVREAFTGTNSNLSSNGYQKLPSGLIIQWGNGTSLTTGVNTNVFPIAFPNVCLSVTGSAVNASVYADVFELAGSILTTSFTSAVVSSGAGGATAQVATGYFWIAIGY